MLHTCQKPSDIPRIFVFLLLVAAHVFAATQDTHTFPRDTLRAMGDKNFPPYEFLDPNGQPQGFNVDLLHAVSRIMDLQIDIELTSWDVARQSLEQGKIDLLTGMFYSHERDSLVDFCLPHLVMHHSMFVRRDNYNIHSLKDLADKVVVVQKDDIMNDFIMETGLAVKPLDVNSPLEALRLLSVGGADCAMLGKFQGIFLIEKYHLANLQAIGPAFFSQRYSMAVCEGDRDLASILNEGLSILRQTGEFEKIYEQWFSAYELRPMQRYSTPIKITFSVILIGLILSYVWIHSLQRLVLLRTHALALSEERWKYALEGSGDGVWDWQVATGEMFLSPRWKALLGYGEELPDRFSSWEERGHPEDMPHALKAIDDHLKQKTAEYFHEHRLLHKDGEYHWFLSRGKVIQWNGGNPVRMLGTMSDISDRKQVEARVQRDLAEKEVLLKEIHHRVKNNLQIISSLLSLQTNHLEPQNVIERFRESQDRIRSIALVHEILYRSPDLARINFREYVDRLLANLYHSYGIDRGSVALDIQIEGISLPIDQAVPCGLIVNELVSNALKHAFPGSEKRGNRIELVLTREEDQIQLLVRDNGVGLPAGFDIHTGSSLGMRLVRILAEEQLSGSLSIDQEKGTAFRVIF